MTHTGRDGDPNEPELLREDRDRLRRELGQTVTELSDKFDVRARAEEKAHDIAESGRHRVREAKHGALETADQARERAHELIVRAESAAPAPVVDRTRQLADATRARPVTVLAGGASAAVLGWLIVRRLMPQRRAAAERRARGAARRSASTRRRLEAQRHRSRQAAERRRIRSRGRAIVGRTVKPVGRVVSMSRATTPLGVGTLLAAGAKRRADVKRARAKGAGAGRADAKRAARRAGDKR
ncbi:DUF3618 domain-containing protein [Nocardia brevicatena]|uniref:DUF3618 domain-containing protein n=1 Tax=Nocardia brevicatena TaxID=37327 RepID=UPI0002ECE517|nr:DUF3618 domain-containing protein [Nocardia brevicatena]